MSDLSTPEQRRAALRQRYLDNETSTDGALATAGVHHLVLIASDLDATVRFYTEILQMRLVKVIENRDDPTSTHIFIDMGGGNLLAFFDFPEHGTNPTVRGIGAMHHVAIKASPDKYQAIVATLERQGIAHSIHGSAAAGSVYMRDPDDIMIEITTSA